MNSGTALPLQALLANLLCLLGDTTPPGTITSQQHPFDNPIIVEGGAAKILCWLSLGAHMLCPSCHALMHKDEFLPADTHPKAETLFKVFNKGLQEKYG